MKVSKYITISDCFRSHEFEVSVDVDLDDIRCAITEDKESESGVLRSFSDFIRFSQSVPEEDLPMEQAAFNWNRRFV